MNLRSIALSALAEDSATSPAVAEPSAGNINLAAHDRRFHPHGYDPDRDSCSLRADLDKGDNPDAAVGSAPSPQGEGWNPAERAEAERAAAALRRILGGVTVTFSDKPYSGNSDTRKSIRQEEFDRWNNIIDQYEKGEVKATQSLLLLPSTPIVLQKVGVPNLPITVMGGIIDKMTGVIPTKDGKLHGIPPSELRNLQIELDNPIAVFDSATRNDSKVILTRLIDDRNKERAVVSIVMDREASGKNRINAISSAYGKAKGSFDFWLADNLLRYVNKEARSKSARWLQLPGDSKLRALRVLTEKDFSGEELGAIVPNSSAERNGGSEDSLIRSDTGKVVGEYDRSIGKITLYPGANTADVVHEFSHGLWQFAEEEAAAGRRSLLDKMHEIAVSAPKSVKDAVAADYPEASDSVYLEECFTHEMARRSDTAFAKAIDSNEGKPWYRKAWGAIKSIWNGYASKHRADKADIDKAASLPPAEAADFILGEMARGRNFGTVSHSGNDGGKRKSIIGEKGAAALGIGKLDEAQKMSKDGASREDIWRKTGWWRGKDGKWRVEIPDAKRIGFKGDLRSRHFDGHTSFRLNELVSAESLGKAHPEMFGDGSGMVVIHVNDDTGFTAAYSPSLDTIEIPRNMLITGKYADGKDWAHLSESGLSMVVHEIQHAIQKREGFATGADGRQTEYDTYRRTTGEVEGRNVERRLSMSPEERAATPPWETEDVPEDRQIVRDSAPAFDPRAFARYLATT